MKGSVFTDAYKHTPVLQNSPISASSAKSLLNHVTAVTAPPYHHTNSSGSRVNER